MLTFELLFCHQVSVAKSPFVTSSVVPITFAVSINPSLFTLVALDEREKSKSPMFVISLTLTLSIEPLNPLNASR